MGAEENRAKIIEVLRDDREYYYGLGKQFMSNSDIDALLNNPRDYNKDREDNKSFAEGRLFHQMILEPEKAKNTPYCECSNRNTKIYKDYCTEKNVDFALLLSEVEAISYLVSVMKGNIAFFDEIYKPGNKFEVPNIGVIKGMPFKGKADIETDEILIDLKTTSDIQKFKYSAKSYNYDSQCYIYQQLFNKPLVFYVIDKSTAQIGIFRPTENFILGGERKVERAIEVFNKYYGPSPTDNIINYFIEEYLD